jgi:uncharacterized membrane protein YcjF (UPF0283 family)
MDGRFIRSLGATRKNQPLTFVMLKIIEVVVLIFAGICFVSWQFRDLRRAREITRKQREAEQAQSTKDTPGAHDAFVKGGPHGG